ncbi:MAG: MFS transporter [Vulcanibacillus sp.]
MKEVKWMSETVKFKIFYFLRYFGDAFFYPFMTMYFIYKGMQENQVGIILAITPIITILVNPIWNFIVKDTKISRLVLKIMTLLEGLFIILLTQISGLELYALLIGLIAFFCSPFISIQDGYTSTYTNIHKIEYSSIRIYASIAYVIASAIAGFIIQYIGYTLPFIISGTFFALTALVAFWIKPIERDIIQEKKKKRDLKALFRNANFYKYLIFYTLVIGAVRIADSYFGIFLTNELNLSLSMYGLLYAGFVSVEVITLRFLTIKGSLYQERTLIMIASLLFFIRIFTYALYLPLGLMLAITMLRGLSWGTIIYTNIKYVIKIVKVENITSAILFMTLTFSLFIGIGNFIFGSLIKVIGYQWLYVIDAGLILIGLLIFFIFPSKTSELSEYTDS